MKLPQALTSFGVQMLDAKILLNLMKIIQQLNAFSVKLWHVQVVDN